MEKRTLRKEKTNPGKMILILLLTVVVLTAGNWYYTECIAPSLQPLADEIEFEEDAIVVSASNWTRERAPLQILEYLDTYFTDEDHGAAYFDDNQVPHFNIVKGGMQRKNLERFFAIANKELASKKLPTFQLHYVKHSLAELEAVAEQLARDLDENNIIHAGILINPMDNRVVVFTDDLSQEGCNAILQYAPKGYVILADSSIRRWAKSLIFIDT